MQRMPAEPYITASWMYRAFGYATLEKEGAVVFPERRGHVTACQEAASSGGIAASEETTRTSAQSYCILLGVGGETLRFFPCSPLVSVTFASHSRNTMTGQQPTVGAGACTSPVPSSLGGGWTLRSPHGRSGRFRSRPGVQCSQTLRQGHSRRQRASRTTASQPVYHRSLLCRARGRHETKTCAPHSCGTRRRRRFQRPWLQRRLARVGHKGFPERHRRRPGRWAFRSSTALA